MVPFFDLKRQSAAIREEVVAAIDSVCDSCQFALGDEVAQFENEFARYHEVNHAVACSSGTSALHLALLAAGIGAGDEVITTPMTFIATCEAISYVGAKPVFVDADPETRNIDASKIEPAITDKTRAIMPVHLYGQPADMTVIQDIARRHDLKLIEDCAQAHGALTHGRRVGSFGDLGCFSFYPGKNLGAYGEAGIVATQDEALANKMRVLRDHGQTKKYCHEFIGYNYRMDGFQGAVLRIKLRHLDDYTAARRRLAARYRVALDGSPVECPTDPLHSQGVYHLFPIVVDDREGLIQYLNEQQIGTGLHYPIPVHLQPAYAELGHREGDFPVAERLATHSLSLPLFPEMTDEEQNEVIAALQNWFSTAHADSRETVAVS